MKKIMNTLICAFALLICESIDFYFQENHIHLFGRQVLGSLSYCFRIGCVGLCAVIAQRNNKIHIKAIYIASVLHSILCIINIWCPVIFCFNPDHSWSTESLFIVPFIFTFFYVLFYIEASIKIFWTNRGEALVVLGIITLCGVGTGIELIWNFKTLLPTTYILCLFFYFLCLNIQLYRRDTLTNLLNRRSFYIDLKVMRNKRFYIVSMDLNNLKTINDTKGHKAGDVAICTSVHIMENCFKKVGKVYRTGGDEFIAIIKHKKNIRIAALISEFQEEMMKTVYSVACGFAEYKPGDNVDKVIEESDTKMYVNKKYLKGLI